MLDEPQKTMKTELRDVKILPFGTNEQGDTITAEGASVPDEVPVFRDSIRSVGRAVLKVKDDGIYADIMLSLGSVEGFEPTAIVLARAFDKVKDQSGRNITSYEIAGVGLNPVAKVNIDETTKPEQTSE